MQQGQADTAPPTTDEDGVLPRFSRPQVTPRTVVVVLFTTLVFAGALYLLWELREIIRWLVVAVFLAVALYPAVNWLAARRLPRAVAILLVYLAFLLILGVMGALVLPPLVDQVQGLADAVVTMMRQPGGPDQALEDLANRYGVAGYLDELRDQLSALPGRLSVAAGPLLAVTRGIVGSITAFISILLMTFFLLLDGERFVTAAANLFPASARPRLRRVLDQAARAVYGYLSGNLAISLIAGIATFIVLIVLGMPYAVALALVVALFDLIPLVGATLGAAVVIIVGLFVDPVKGGILAVYFLLYQQFENNVLQPLVYGRSVRLHPLAIFLAVLAGGQLLGILGALLAIPVAEIIRILGAEWLAGRAQATGGTVHGAQEDTPIDQVTADVAEPAARSSQ